MTRTAAPPRSIRTLQALAGAPYMNAEIERTGAVLWAEERSRWAIRTRTWATTSSRCRSSSRTRRAPKQDERVTFTFLADLASAVEQAKAAAGDRVVQVVGGPPGLIQQLLREGLVDELRVDVMPVILGAGLRLLENVEGVRSRRSTSTRSASGRASPFASWRHSGALVQSLSRIPARPRSTCAGWFVKSP